MTGLNYTEKEEAVIALVTSAFGPMNLQVSTVDVNKAEGGTVSTVRFTLEDSASTDLERTRIDSGAESPQDLAMTVVTELRRQIGR